MTITACRWVLFVSLVILIPMPWYMADWLWSPVGRLIQLGIQGRWAQLPVNSFVILWQLLLWSSIVGLLAWAYGRWTASWQHKIRGSIMGLGVFTLLILFSSISVYQGVPVLDGSNQWISFREVYQ